MKQEVIIGQTDYTVLVLIRDDAGAPKTGLTEASIDIAYARVETDNDVTTSDVTPAALSALTDAHTDWGFEEVSATDHPGLYRLDIADAVFASGAWSAVVSIVGTGLDPTSIEFVLVAFNPRDGVRLGLTALPNAAADAAGGLIISDAGGLDADAMRSNISDILTDTGTTLQGELDGIQADTEDIQTRLPAALTGGKMESNIGSVTAGVIAAASFAAGAFDAVWSVAARVLTAGTNIVLAKGTGVTGFNDLSAAQVNAEADTALSDYDPPTRAELTTDTNSILSKLLKYVQLMLRKDAAIATDNSTEVTAINADGGSGGGAFANTTDSLEAIRDKETDIETDTQDIQGRLPAALVSGRIDASVGAMAANVLTASALATDAVNEIVDQTWREAIADHEGTAGSTAEALATAGGSGASAADIADAVWDEAKSGHVAAGSFGELAAQVLEDTGTTLQGELDGIQADTEDIQGRLPAALVSGRIDASVGAMAANVMTAAAAAADLTTELQSGLATAAALTTVEGKIDTIDTVVDTILVDTNELQTDWVNGGRLDLIIDAILADTNELQTDWVNGGRLDLLIDAIKAKTDNLPASPAAVGSAMTLTSGERDAVAAALLDLAAGIETGLTLRQAMRLAVASAAGKLSGAATTTVTIRNAVADSKDRIVATVDADGNRSAITTDLT